MRRAAKVDANHSLIVATFRALGNPVQDLSRVGDGFPDLLVRVGNELVLVEVKDGRLPPSRRRLTADQKAWRVAWGGPVHDVKSEFEAEELVQRYRARQLMAKRQTLKA